MFKRLLSKFETEKTKEKELIDACAYGSTNGGITAKERVIKLLEDPEINVNAFDQQILHRILKVKVTAFGWACERDRIELMKLLLDDPRTDVNLGDPFAKACQLRNFRTVHFLLKYEKVDINKEETNITRTTPFKYACSIGLQMIPLQMIASGREVDMEGAILTCEQSAIQPQCRKELIDLITSYKDDRLKTIQECREKIALNLLQWEAECTIA